VIDGRALAVLGRLEQRDADERARGLPPAERARQVAPTTGRLLFALAARRPGTSILEVGGSRGYSGVWLAAGARVAGGRLTSLEIDPARVEAWHESLTDAGLDDVAQLVAGDAFETLATLTGPFDLVFIDAEKNDYEALFTLARPKLAAGAVVVADNVFSHVDTLGAYSAARQRDPSLVSVTVPLDRGLEVTSVLPEAGSSDVHRDR
jgi:predicted O-methyltransferase YrrM